MQKLPLVPYPQKLKTGRATFAFPGAVSVSGPAAARRTVQALKKDLAGLAGIRCRASAAFRIRLSLAPGRARPEGYRLTLDAKGAAIVAADAAGLYYGTQTLLQIILLGDRKALPELSIEDWPAFKIRSYMVDLGRSLFPLPMLERVVRILARLKMNTLHLHLNDDPLCGLRFRKLPLGKENPGALTLAQLGRLVRYARQHHVAILPEFECWGHAHSSIFHFPELYGGMGMYGSMSFGIGEETFRLFERAFDELVPMLETDCMLHVGLDEAHWYLLPSVPPDERDKYSPTTLVARLHDIVQAAGKKHGRRITMHLWADHGGRPLPRGLEKKVVVQPWNYDRFQEKKIRAKIRQYGGKGKPRIMLGAGMSSLAFGGSFAATRLWCQLGAGVPNVEGVTICHWEDNDIPERMIGLYMGADYAWSPATPEDCKDDPYQERLRGVLGLQMRKWQAAIRDADDEALRRDRGPQVFRGYYCWGARAGKPVAPTVEMTKPELGGAFA